MGNESKALNVIMGSGKETAENVAVVEYANIKGGKGTAKTVKAAKYVSMGVYNGNPIAAPRPRGTPAQGAAATY